MLLAGDVGGTKTLLGLFEDAGGARPVGIDVREYATLDHGSLQEIVARFLTESARPASGVTAAAFGVAGPVIDRTARMSNVPWTVDARALADRFAIPRVALINDLAAMAHAVPVLAPTELSTLQTGEPSPTGNIALIAAGTGLGQALLHRVDGRLIPSPSEGGHADFAARTPRELELVVELTRAFGRAECEHVMSGPGLANLFRFTHAGPCAVVSTADEAELPALVSASALAKRCAQCEEALDLFVSAYGAEAGNLALRAMATSGLYVGGGIAPKILPALESGRFMRAFRAKGDMTPLLARVPVFVILDARAGLLGAAVRAARIP
jgi:glucokinase